MGNDFHRGPWLIDKRLSIGAGFTVRPRDQKNPASFRTFNDADGEFARRIVRALDQADVAPELLEACRWFVAQLDDKVLVRDISRDGEPDWPMRMLRFTSRLSEAIAAIAKATSDG